MSMCFVPFVPPTLAKSDPLLGDLGLPLSAPTAISVYDPTALGLYDLGTTGIMSDEERQYWTANSTTAPSQPAYNSFMYPAPAAMHSTNPHQQFTQPNATWVPQRFAYEAEVPSISIQSESCYNQHIPMYALPTPTVMPEMVPPTTPSSEGTRSPALADGFSLPTAEWHIINSYAAQSVHSSPASNMQDLHAQTPGITWEQNSPFSPNVGSFHQQQQQEYMARNRSSSDGELPLTFEVDGFAPGSYMPPSNLAMHRRHSSHVPYTSINHGMDRFSASPYASARSLRDSPAMSRMGSPNSQGLPDLVADDLSDVASDLPIISKAVVTTDPVSEAASRRRTHEARFECEICHKRLTTKTNLEGHRKSHLGVKEFKCGVCEKPFTRDWDRKRHERTHSKKAELSCQTCGKTSTRKDAFDKHRCRAPSDSTPQLPQLSLAHPF